MTRLLTNEDIEQVLTMPDCLQALEVAYRDHARGRAIGSTSRVETILPTQDPGVEYEFTSIEGAIPSFDVMALRCNSNHMAVRLIDGMKRKDRLPDAPGGRYVGLIFLFSLADLRLVGILQDAFISAMRVGATNALAARELASPGAAVVGLLGSGDQAQTQLVGLAAVRSLWEVRVYSPNRERREAFAEMMSREIGVPVSAVESAREAVRGADFLVAATNSFQPVFESEWAEPGMHISAILSPEVPPEVYDLADVVIVNTHSGYGRGQAGHYDNSADWSRYSTLGELLLSDQPGRADGQQVTFFMNNAGLGTQFAAVGARALELAEAEDLGRDLPDEWFLQTRHT